MADMTRARNAAGAADISQLPSPAHRAGQEPACTRSSSPQALRMAAPTAITQPHVSLRAGLHR